jgi:16S rRNA (cytosine967-C5)-methyltransferase
VPELLRKHDLEARDRAFVTELVYGTVRMRRALDHLLARVVSRPLDTLDPDVRVALRLGAFQLFTGVSAHAAVGETVSLVPERARGFANGVLRSLARSGPPWNLPQGDSVMALGTRTSHPDWIVQSFIDELGHADALATLDLDNEPPAVTLRVNAMRTTVEEATAELTSLGVDVEPATLVPNALLVRHTGDLGALELVRDGRVTPQDQGSQAVVLALDPQPGDRVLDVAAAPGGKAVAAAERMRDNGLVVAADVHQARVRTVMRAAARCALTTVVPTVADGRRLPFVTKSFDRVLVDAPCTGLGTLRRNPDLKVRQTAEGLAELNAKQRSILGAAASLVKPGGRLVYGTCSLLAEENEDIVREFLAANPDFALVPVKGILERQGVNVKGAGDYLHLYPHVHDTDGFFAAVMERAGKKKETKGD